jgi:hypothetical protein
MTTPWVRNHVAFATAKFTERQDRTALKHLFEVLSVYPMEEDALKIAGTILYVNTRKSSVQESREPLSRTDISDPRLDSLFCACDKPGCTSTWVSARVGFPDHRKLVVSNPIGGRCNQCRQYFCKRHFDTAAIGQTAKVARCPNCLGMLDPVPPPNGRSSEQTVRLNKPLVHVILLTEGPTQPSPEYLQEIFQTIAPDVLEDNSKISATPIGKWRDDAKGLALAIVANQHQDYLSKEYDLRTAEIRDQHGARLVIVKVYANRAKFVDSSASGEHRRRSIEPIGSAWALIQRLFRRR